MGWCAMFMSKRVFLGIGLSSLVVASGLPGRSVGDDTVGYGLGRPATDAEIRAWNIDVAPNGEGLPPGQGTVKQGGQVYAAKCAKCHGASGTEGPLDRLVGGQDTLRTSTPIKSIGSYWPYATTLYDYINRAMPLDAPQSLAPDEIYAVIAWLLHENGIIAEDIAMNARTLPLVQMPNRHGFVPDPRPDVGGP